MRLLFFISILLAGLLILGCTQTQSQPVAPSSAAPPAPTAPTPSALNTSSTAPPASPSTAVASPSPAPNTTAPAAPTDARAQMLQMINKEASTPWATSLCLSDGGCSNVSADGRGNYRLYRGYYEEGNYTLAEYLVNSTHQIACYNGANCDCVTGWSGYEEPTGSGHYTFGGQTDTYLVPYLRNGTAQVTLSPSRTVLGVQTTCFRVASPSMYGYLYCYDPATGALLVEGAEVATAYRTQVSEDEFQLPDAFDARRC